MSQIHIKLKDKIHKSLKKKAHKLNYSLQEFVEKALETIDDQPDFQPVAPSENGSRRNGKPPLFTFIDLFAGIGGIRLGFENAGFNCVFSSEIDKFCNITYKSFFGHLPDNLDITSLTNDRKTIKDNIPPHSILTAGFPCQPFSLAGVSKKSSMNKPHGFDDETSGTLFFNIKQIIEAREPDIIFLENVKNLKSHNNGTTFKIIEDTLRCPRKDLRYLVSKKIIDASKWVPQHRERIYILAVKEKFRNDIDEDCLKSVFPDKPTKKSQDLNEILIKNLVKYNVTPIGTSTTIPVIK